MTPNPAAEVVARVRSVYGRWRRDTTIAEMRADWDELFVSNVAAEIEPVDIGGTPCAWIRPRAVRQDAAIVYLHGGGFQIGSLLSHREIMARLASEAGVQVLGVDYRLGPEHPLPAAFDDAAAVLDGLERQGFAANRFAMAGDSAGAMAILAAIFARLEAGRPAPAAAYLMSAWTDLTASGESYERRASLDPIHNRPLILAMARVALGPRLAEARKLSPFYFSDELLERLPPTLTQVGERETLVSDSEAFAARARAAGAEVDCEIWPEMVHVFQQFPDLLPQAREAVAEGGRFLAAALARETAEARA
jgi:epsilon-lactone hydrolase